MGQLRGAIVTQWNNIYPGIPFPRPSQNPQMFPENFVVKTVTYNYDYSWWDQIWDDCCAYSRCCAKGLIDYECQYNNSCYLNLIQLGIHIIEFLLATIILTIIFGYASKLAYKFIVSAAFITKFMSCIAGFMKCFTFGVFDENVYYRNQQPKAQFNEEEKKILQFTEQLDVKIVISRLDQYQKKRILEIKGDYQIINQRKDENKKKQEQKQKDPRKTLSTKQNQKGECQKNNKENNKNKSNKQIKGGKSSKSSK